MVVAQQIDRKMGKCTYENILKSVGDLGVYQMALFSFCACLAFCSVETIYMNFVGYKMDHWCEVPELSNFSFNVQKQVAIPYESADSNTTYDTCRVFVQNYSSLDPKELLNWKRNESAATTDCNSWVFDRSVYSQNIVNEFELVCGKSWLVDFVSTISLSGFLFGSICGGSISDRFGRVKALGVGLVLKTVSNFASAFAPNYIVFIIARFFVGWSAQQCYVVGFVLAIENVGPSHRSWIGILYSIFFSLGFAFVPLFAFACRNWTDLQIVMAAPTIIFLLTVWFLPESPRWLISRGRLTEAEAGLRQIAAVNKRQFPEGFKVSDIQIDTEGNGNKKTALDILKTPKIRRYSFIQFFIWFSVNLIYYALSLNAGSLVGDVFLNTSLLGLVEIPACVLCFIAMGIKLTGRKYTVGLANIIGGVACLICVPVIIADEESIAVTVLSLVGKAGATAAFNGIYVYTSEIYPTEVRNVGLGTCSMVARLSGIAAPYIGGLFGDIWSPLPSLIFGIFGTISGLLTFLLPETLGKCLPETIAELESGSLEETSKSKKNRSECGECVAVDSISDYELCPSKNGSQGLEAKGIDNLTYIEKF